MMLKAPVVVVCGHYGVGKTNFALNLAHDARAAGCAVTLVDLDVVNPYFRSSDYAKELAACGVRVIAPVFAALGTSLDVPSLTGAIVPAIEEAQQAIRTDASAEFPSRMVIIDAGGDDAGASAPTPLTRALPLTRDCPRRARSRNIHLQPKSEYLIFPSEPWGLLEPHGGISEIVCLPTHRAQAHSSVFVALPIGLPTEW